MIKIRGQGKAARLSLRSSASCRAAVGLDLPWQDDARHPAGIGPGLGVLGGDVHVPGGLLVAGDLQRE